MSVRCCALVSEFPYSDYHIHGVACFLARGVDHIDVSPVFTSMLLHCEAARHTGLLRVAVVHLMACVCVCVCVCARVCDRM